MRVVHVITGTEVGGAERALQRLLGAWGASFENIVVGLAADGPIADAIRGLGVTVHSLGLERGGRAPLRAAAALARLLRQLAPDLVQGWMYHGNLAAFAAAALAGMPGRVLWNIRNSPRFHERMSASERFSLRWCRLFSSWPAATLYNSEAIRAEHAAIGFADRQSVVIHNGIPLAEFACTGIDSAKNRAAFGFGTEDVVIAYLARAVPIKNHAGFFEAAAAAHGARPRARFLVAGSGAMLDNPLIGEPVRRLGLAVTCLGRRDDVAGILAAVDIAASASFREGFPTALAEAMASGRPCVATDAGGTAMLIGGNGIVVPVGDSAALVRAMVAMIDEGASGRAAIGEAARRSVAERFALDAVAGQYRALYANIVAGRGASTVPRV